MQEQREKEDAAQLDELRQAIQVGMSDIEAGNFCEFRTTEDLRRYFASLSVEALAVR